MSNNTNNKPEEKKIELVNDSPVLFKQSAGTEYLTKVELCDLINGVFGGIFDDVYGISMRRNDYGVIEVDVAFKHKDDAAPGKIQATTKIGTDKSGVNNPIIGAISTLSATSFNRRLFDLTETAKIALSKFMIPETSFYNDNGNIYAANNKINNKVGGINWNGRYTYYDVPGENQILVVSGFSIDAIMGLIHGTEIDGHAVQYHVSFERPIGFSYAYNGIYNAPNQNYLVRIEQADVNEIAELAGKVNNVIPIPNSPISNIVRR